MSGSSNGRRRVLIVCAAYPPHRSPTGHRSRFLAAHASKFGWDAETLAVNPSDYGEDPDDELARLLPTNVPVTRTTAWPTRLTRPLGVGDIGIRSYFAMREALGRICETRRPDVLYVPGWPFYTFRMALWAKRRYGVPYVLDYTDPWVCALTPEQQRLTNKTYWADRIARVLEPDIVRAADHVVGVSMGTHDSVRARLPEIPAERFSAVPFGFEPGDFDALRARPRHNPFWDAGDGNIHLVYVGAMLPHGYETLRALFAALIALRGEEPALFGRVRIHFFGTTYAANPTEDLVMPVAREMGLGDVVTEHARRIPYVDALNVLTSAGGILSLGSSERHYTASKIYPCIIARRPLLALYHEASSVGEVMRKAGVRELVDYGDEVRAGDRVPEIAAALRRLVERALDPEPTPAPNLEGMAEFTAERSARHITGVFDAIVGRASAAHA